MIKVKGQLGEMAKCLEDEEPRVSDLAKLFFTELSTKDNAIYNNLPDGRRSFFFFSLVRFCSWNVQSSVICRLGNMPSTKRRSRARCATSSPLSKK